MTRLLDQIESPSEDGIQVAVINARFVKPVDEPSVEFIRESVTERPRFATIR